MWIKLKGKRKKTWLKPRRDPINLPKKLRRLMRKNPRRSSSKIKNWILRSKAGSKIERKLRPRRSLTQLISR